MSRRLMAMCFYGTELPMTTSLPAVFDPLHVFVHLFLLCCRFPPESKSNLPINLPVIYYTFFK